MKSYLSFFKRTVILLFAVGTLSSADGCFGSGDEKIDCKECIKAQIHLCEALRNTRGDFVAADNAVQKVKKACGSLGDEKVKAVRGEWALNSLNCGAIEFTCE